MRVCLFLASGFEPAEAVIIIDIIRRAEISVDTFSISDKKEVMSNHNIILTADKTINEFKYEDYDAFILPGGMEGVKNLSNSSIVCEALVAANKDEKIIGAICAAPVLLAKLGILKNREAVVYPGLEKDMLDTQIDNQSSALVDENIVTGASVGSAFNFSLAFIDSLDVEIDVFKLRQKLVMRD